MAVTGIDHVQLAMPAGGEALARAFYRDLLGLAEVPKPPALAARGGCWFEAAGARVHLGVDPDFRPARKAHPGLCVDDLDALAKRLASARVAIAPGDGAGDGRCHIYADDPFGNRLELIGPAKSGE